MITPEQFQKVHIKFNLEIISPTHNALTQLSPTNPLWTYKCLIYCYSMPHSVASVQGTHFILKELRQWAPVH